MTNRILYGTLCAYDSVSQFYQGEHMKDYSIKGTMTKAEMFGRIPTPKRGGALTSKKGKKGYNRRAKHKKGWSNDCPSFC